VIRLSGYALTALAMFGAPAVRGADFEIQPFSALYSVEWHGINAGTSTLELTRQNDSTWLYRSRNTARGLFLVAIPDPVTETSVFRIVEDTVEPLHYTSDNGSRKERNQDLYFDWDRRRATGQSQQQPVDLALEKGAQDNLSVQIALMRELRRGRAPTQFTLIDDKVIKTYEYKAEGTATLDTAIGRLDTVIYTSHRVGSPRMTRLWLAPSLGFLPVQGEQLKRGKREIQMKIISTTMPLTSEH